VFGDVGADPAGVSPWRIRRNATIVADAGVGNGVGEEVDHPTSACGYGRRHQQTMEQQKKPENKPKGLNLSVKTLEKKSAPMRAAVNSSCPVIGYS
jgi:hypothetical protein